MRLRGCRVALWVEEREGVPAVNPVVGALLRDLAADGATVGVVVPERHLIDAGSTNGTFAADLVLLKTPTRLGISWAVALEVAGRRFLNGARATLRAHDKAATVARLAAAGLAVPRTYLSSPGTVAAAEAETGAWVAKPTRGVHGEGVVRSDTFAAALAVPMPSSTGRVTDDDTRLVQRWIGGGDEDVKVYVAGASCFAAEKRFGPASYASNEVAPVTLDRATTDLVRAAGEALGLRCYGVDLRREQGRATIVDVNPFPGYRGFPAAVPALRAEIDRALGVS